MNAKQDQNPEKNFFDMKIRLIPRSSREEIVGKEGDVYKAKVTYPPVGGKANAALISLIAKRLKIPKGSIEIKTGRNSRIKVVRVYGLTRREVVELLG